MKRAIALIASAALLIGVVGCAQLIGPQALSDNYALMAGAESNRPAFIDGDHSSAADTVFPSGSGGMSRQLRSPASEAHVRLPVAKTINRVKIYSKELLGVDLYVEDPTQGWKLEGRYDGLKGPVIDLKLKGIVYTSGVKLRVRRAANDAKTYRENTEAVGGTRYISGRTRSSAKIYEIELYGPAGSSGGDDVIEAAANADVTPMLKLEGMEDMTPAEPQPVQPSATALGAAPNFTLPMLDGKNLSLSDYKGRVVLVNFWATWCGPCIDEMPALQAVRDELNPRGFEVIAISIDKEGDYYQTDAVKEKVQNFVRDHNLNFQVVLGNAEVRNLYGGVGGIPHTFIVDANGNIVSDHLGKMKYQEIKAAVEEAYGELE